MSYILYFAALVGVGMATVEENYLGAFIIFLVLGGMGKLMRNRAEKYKAKT
jgi:hypothetical protein